MESIVGDEGKYVDQHRENIKNGALSDNVKHRKICKTTLTQRELSYINKLIRTEQNFRNKELRNFYQELKQA